MTADLAISVQRSLLSGDDAWALLDFEYVGYGWRVFDIATFFNNQFTQRGRIEHTRGLLDAFLNGYQSERPLSAAELAALPAFVTLRQLWNWGVAVTNQAIWGAACSSTGCSRFACRSSKPGCVSHGEKLALTPCLLSRRRRRGGNQRRWSAANTRGKRRRAVSIGGSGAPLPSQWERGWG